jgi:3-phosphoshikimate 1-carboxyvinyltransferase
MSRDHTERMLRLFGVRVDTISQEQGHLIKVKGFQELESAQVYCPADPSSAAFFIALATLSENSELLLEEVLINPTRDGFIRKVMEMGANIELINRREISMEPVADILVRSSARLRAVEVKADEVPSLIDEIPVLAVLMAFAEGTSIVRGAKELRVKESDRIRSTVENLRRMGVEVEEFEDGFAVKGAGRLKGAKIKTYSDHRIAMAFTVAGLVAEGETLIDDIKCVQISYPEFYRDITAVSL